MNQYSSAINLNKFSFISVFEINFEKIRKTWIFIIEILKTLSFLCSDIFSKYPFWGLKKWSLVIRFKDKSRTWVSLLYYRLLLEILFTKLLHFNLTEIAKRNVYEIAELLILVFQREIEIKVSIQSTLLVK